jgi:hypothetical protein
MEPRALRLLGMHSPTELTILTPKIYIKKQSVSKSQIGSATEVLLFYG